MTFNEAVKRKRQFIKDSSEYTNTLYHCLVIPAKTEESARYLEDFKNSPSTFIDESCKIYSTDSDFKVMVVPIKDFQANLEGELVNI